MPTWKMMWLQRGNGTSSAQMALAARCQDWSSRLRRCGRPSSCGCTARTRLAAAAPEAASAPRQAGPPAAALPRVGDVLDAVRCERLGDGVGICFCKASGRLVLLIRGALPGEQLTARITVVKKGYCEGVKVATLSLHANPATPACRHFGPCGGCSLQSLQYDAQLAHKAAGVAQQLVRVGRLSSEAVAASARPALPASSGERYGYRNKVQLAFSSRLWRPDLGRVEEGAWGLGYHMPGSNSVVLAIHECSLMSPAMNQLAAAVQAAAQALQLQPFDPATGQGSLRHLVIRAAATAPDEAAGAPSRPAEAAAAGAGPETPTAAATAQPPQALMAVIVTTAACKSDELQPLADLLMQQCSSSVGLVSVVHSIERTQAAAAVAAAATGGSSSSWDWDEGVSSSSSSSWWDGSSSAEAPAGLQGHQQQQQQRSKSSHGQGRLRPAGRAKRGSSSGSDSKAASSSRQQQRGARALDVAETRVLAGVPFLQERLCGLLFHVSPHSFFQTNTCQAQQLYGLVVAAVEELYAAAAAASDGIISAAGDATALACSSDAGSSSKGDDDAAEAAGSRPPAGLTGLVLDLYCGTGTISLALAGACRQVVGFDISASSIADAEANAHRNGVSNARFVCGDLTRLAEAGGRGLQGSVAGSDGGGGSTVASGGSRWGGSSAGSLGLSPDVIVVDPARAGLSRSVVDYILGSSARRLVYVSCNAATQARDLQLLCGGPSAVLGGIGVAGGGGRGCGRGSRGKERPQERADSAVDGGSSWRRQHSTAFELVSWTVVDMFPQTSHIETVIVLDRSMEPQPAW